MSCSLHKMTEKENTGGDGAVRPYPAMSGGSAWTSSWWDGEPVIKTKPQVVHMYIIHISFNSLANSFGIYVILKHVPFKKLLVPAENTNSLVKYFHLGGFYQLPVPLD